MLSYSKQFLWEQIFYHTKTNGSSLGIKASSDICKILYSYRTIIKQ